MAPLKKKGDLAELKVAADLGERGYGIAWPHSEDCDFDLIAYRGDELHRVQVKYTRSDGRVVAVRPRSSSLTNGRVRKVKRYTAATIDWIAAYDASTSQCLYIPARELGTGMNMMHIRLTGTANNQHIGIRYATHYEYFGPDPPQRLLGTEMEPDGFEPTAS